jgi:hypothetical protein
MLSTNYLLNNNNGNFIIVLLIFIIYSALSYYITNKTMYFKM